MPDSATIPLYGEASQASTPLPVNTNREHEVQDIGARTTSRLAYAVTAAAIALAGTVATLRSGSARASVADLLANVSQTYNNRDTIAVEHLLSKFRNHELREWCVHSHSRPFTRSRSSFTLGEPVHDVRQ